MLSIFLTVEITISFLFRNIIGINLKFDEEAGNRDNESS